MELYSKTYAFLFLFSFFFSDSLVDLVKSLIIMQGYFPGVVSYKDPTVNMIGDSWDRNSSGSKWNPFANC